MEHIQAFLETLKQGGKQTHLNLTLFPLLAPDTGEPDYLTLEDALNQGLVEVTEVSQGGSVPDLKLINKSPSKLLVVDGEELVGAKQNRIVNATFLIAGNTEINIPVSCMEQGRWSYRSQKFASGKKVMPAIMRLKNQRAVVMNLKQGAGYRSNQGMIWDELALKADRMKAYSPTGAMADLFEGQRDRLGEYLTAFRPVDCQVGAVFAVNTRVTQRRKVRKSRPLIEKPPALLFRTKVTWRSWPLCVRKSLPGTGRKCKVPGCFHLRGSFGP